MSKILKLSALFFALLCAKDVICMEKLNDAGQQMIDHQKIQNQDQDKQEKIEMINAKNEALQD